MNAYFVDAGDAYTVVEHIADLPRYEEWRVCHLVYAETRGRAKSLFVRNYGEAIEFSDIRSCRLVAKDVKAGEGLAHPNDPLWEKVPE